MRYKPNFCCNCGEKIERPNPSIADSKMFCDVCKHDFVLPRAAPFIFCAAMALVGLFGIANLWRGSTEQPLTVSTRQFAANGAVSSKIPPVNASQVSPTQSVRQTAQTNNAATNAANAANLTTKQPPKPSEQAPIQAEETVYFCGAMTKKGTPCSRRVKGGGRCWQHKGQAAMLPPEKLLASQ